MQEFRSVRGMKDFFLQDIKSFNFIIENAKNLAKVYNFEEVMLPILEYSNIFERNLGNTSDIVAKEIYKFESRGGDMLALRPEFTAGIGRHILEHGRLFGPFPRKLFSYGPVFRYDRPQKGRYRQFNQLNFESLGYWHEELIQMAVIFLHNLGIIDCTVEINYLGTIENRTKYEKELYKFLISKKDQLSEDSQKRLTENILRILDSKDKNDQEILKNAPSILEFIANDKLDWLQQLQKKISLLNIKCVINHKLVRGLDYYTGFVFEITTQKLGTQSAICGGGEYDIISSMTNGNKSMNSFGFAMGIERLMELMDPKLLTSDDLIGIIMINDNNINLDNLCNKLRNENKRVERIIENDLKKGMKRAEQLKCSLIYYEKNGEIIEKKYE